MPILIRNILSCLMILLCAMPAALAAHKKTHVQKANTPPAIQRKVSEFDSINIGGDFQTTVNNHHPQQILIHTTSAYAKCVLTDVNGTTLFIHQLTTTACKHSKPIALTINIPDLKGIMTQGDNDTTVNKLSTTTFLSYSSGRSHLNLNGKTRSLNSVLSGEASVNAHKLDTKSALVSASGNSQMQLQTQDSLFVRASGNATIRYSGNPKKLTKSLSGTSSVEHDSNSE